MRLDWELLEPLPEDWSVFLKGYASFFESGKMLRARCVYLVSDALGSPDQTRDRIALAVELIHGASLLHDDVIDGALVRRGQPAMHASHGVNGAILCGDFLFLKAVTLLGGEAQRLLLTAACEVVEGEGRQELFERAAVRGWSDVIECARQKTGSLFGFACAAPAEGHPLFDRLMTVGELIGTLYQIQDDLMDGDYLDKTTGTDAQRQKMTARSALDAPSDLWVWLNIQLNELLAGLADLPALQLGFSELLFQAFPRFKKATK